MGTVQVALLLGCEGGVPGTSRAPEVSDSTFVATMVRLNVIDRDSLLDSAGRANAKSRLLQEKGLTSEALVQAGRRLADDPRRARELFTAIDKRVDSMTNDRRP